MVVVWGCVVCGCVCVGWGKQMGKYKNATQTKNKKVLTRWDFMCKIMLPLRQYGRNIRTVKPGGKGRQNEEV